MIIANFDNVHPRRQCTVGHLTAHHIEHPDGFACSAVDHYPSITGIDFDIVGLSNVVDTLGIEEMHMESKSGTLLTDIGNLEAGLRGAVGEVRMRVGGGAKSRATCGKAEMSVVDIAIDGLLGCHAEQFTQGGVDVNHRTQLGYCGTTAHQDAGFLNQVGSMSAKGVTTEDASPIGL